MWKAFAKLLIFYSLQKLTGFDLRYEENYTSQKDVNEMYSSICQEN